MYPDWMQFFEIGYDRDYIGAGLHCRLCDPAEPLSLDHFGYGDSVGLQDWMDLATAHYSLTHA